MRWSPLAVVPAALVTQLALPPSGPRAPATAPAEFRVRLDTSKGTIVVEVHRSWASHGADCFYCVGECHRACVRLRGSEKRPYANRPRDIAEGL